MTDNIPATEAELSKLYWGESLTIGEIADRFDRSYSTVWEWFQKYGIERQQPGGRATRAEEKAQKIGAIREYTPCERCGDNPRALAMDFHHTDEAEKYMNISDMRTSSWERIAHELRKCRLLCAICHRIVEHDG